MTYTAHLISLKRWEYGQLFSIKTGKNVVKLRIRIKNLATNGIT